MVNYWNEGQLYYSYLTAGGFMGSIDKIEYDPKYVAVVKQFKEEYGSMVYHVIESSGALILLIVSKYVDDWEYERLKGNRITAYVHNVDAPAQSEFGDVFLSSLHGALEVVGSSPASATIKPPISVGMGGFSMQKSWEFLRMLLNLTPF